MEGNSPGTQYTFSSTQYTQNEPQQDAGKAVDYSSGKPKKRAPSACGFFKRTKGNRMLQHVARVNSAVPLDGGPKMQIVGLEMPGQ